jgi:hypothetical protein
MDSVRSLLTAFRFLLLTTFVVSCSHQSPRDGSQGAAGAGGTGRSTGAAGTTGAAGATGAAGTSGAAGTTGAAGTSGTTGAAGAAGSAGTTGAAGAAGSAGTAGTVGSGGTGGTAGTAGTAGATGSGGAAGAAGAAGNAGTAGAAGAAGSAGTTGAAGAAGIGGAAGAAGAGGAAGGAGTAGSAGATGGAGMGGGGVVCAAGLPACSGDTLTTCNAQGTGYAPGGTSCAPMHCASGACRQPNFIEDFEDGDAVGWNPLSGTLGASAVTNALAAAGTTYSFKESGASLYRTLPATLQPTSVSVWAHATDTQHAAVRIGGLAEIDFGAKVNFGPGTITLNGQPNLFTVQYALDTWIHVELRNIDWQMQTFDVIVDDALVAANVAASLSPTSAIYLSATGAFYWDEIALYQTACTPNRPYCDGDVARVCSPDGSGHTATSSTCNPNSCYLGSCVTSFLSETFEDGNLDGWISNPGTWTATVVTSTAAAGTAHSLELSGGTYFQGPYDRFTNIKPGHIGFWMMGVGGEFVVSTGTTADANLIRVIGMDTILLDGSAYAVPAADLAWHHVELRNINWSARTFDIYVDGALAASKAFPTGVGTSIGRIDIYNVTSNVTRWDEIDVSP